MAHDVVLDYHRSTSPRLGYRMINPDAPVNEPRRFEPVDEDFQRRAEDLFRRMSECP